MNINHQSDKENIDNVINKFFRLFNNKSNSELNLEAIFNLCIPQTIIIKKNGHDQVIYSLESFITPRKIILTDGTLTDFEEFEIKNDTNIMKHIAQRFCRYQKNGVMNGKPFSEFGTKMFHLLKTIEGWKINSVIWEDD